MGREARGELQKVRNAACEVRSACLVIALLGALMLLTFDARHVAAQEATVVESATVENNYPRDIKFKLNARADSDITDVTLSYRLTGRGLSALGKPESLSVGPNVSTEVEILVNTGSSYIPVASEFVWHWEITTADGETLSTEDQTFLFLPPDQDWQNVSNDFMTVYYHGDRQNLANAYLEAGAGTMQKIGTELFGIELRQKPVKVVLFADEAEADRARPGSGQGTADQATTTCGTKVAIDIVFVIPVSCGTPDRTDTLRHEFGHILNETAGEGALGKLPSWMDEGTAVFAQSEPGDNYVGAFEAAARAGRLIPFSQMGTPAANPSQVNLFYGQSYAMVSYLIERDGPEKYADFFATIKSGRRFDQALQEVYGMDLGGFEEEFLESVGSSAQPTAAPTERPQQTQPTVAPTTRPQQTQPTRVPTRSSQQVVSSGDDDGPFDRVAIAVIGGAVMLGLLAVFFFLLSQALHKGPPPGPPPAPPGGPGGQINWGPPSS